MEIFNSRLISAAGVLIFSSGYIGLDSVKMFVGDGIGTLPIMPLVLLTFIFFSRNLKLARRSLRAFILTFILTFIILELAPHRYPGLIFSFLLLDWTYYLINQEKQLVKPIITRNLIFLLIFYIQLVIRPLDILLGLELAPNIGIKTTTFWSNLSGYSLIVQLANIWNFFYSSFYNQFILEKLSSSKILEFTLTSLPMYLTFLFIEYSQNLTRFLKKRFFVRLCVLFAIHSLAILFSITVGKDALINSEFINGALLVSIVLINLLDRQKKEIILIAIAYTLGLSTFFFAAPNLHLSSTYRYFMAYSFISPILLCALFFNPNRPKAAKWITLLPVVLIILLRLIGSNSVLSDFYQDYTNSFHKIYRDLMTNLPSVNDPVIIFMEPGSTKIGFALGDAFRVGELKTESAYAVLYKVPMDKFILPKTIEEIQVLAEKNKIPSERIYHFYYDGSRLKRIAN